MKLTNSFSPQKSQQDVYFHSIIPSKSFVQIILILNKSDDFMQKRVNPRASLFAVEKLNTNA